MELDIVFDGGVARAVYDDALVGVLDALGAVDVQRASHVEPAPGGGWYADMSPSGGPVLFSNCETQSLTSHDVIGRRVGFASRAAALKAERDWLRTHRGL